jgi:ATP-dependent helicase/nuclease subunit A
VLTARVLRLLLQGVGPRSILCLTFTKAGAAEMANRIGARLASWVRLKDKELARRSCSRSASDDDPPTLQRARRCSRGARRAGGLRIQTIHSFAQTLLALPGRGGDRAGLPADRGPRRAGAGPATLADLLADAERPATTS